MFVISQRGPDTLPPLWIRTCQSTNNSSQGTRIYGEICTVLPTSILFTDCSKAFCHLCFKSVFVMMYCCVITCQERADLLTRMCEMFSCVFFTFQYAVMGRVWYLIVSIPDLCLLYFGLCLVFLMCPEGIQMRRSHKH